MAFTSNSTIFHVPTNRTIVKIWEDGSNDNWDWSSNLKFNGESERERENEQPEMHIIIFRMVDKTEHNFHGTARNYESVL